MTKGYCNFVGYKHVPSKSMAFPEVSCNVDLALLMVVNKNGLPGKLLKRGDSSTGLSLAFSPFVFHSWNVIKMLRNIVWWPQSNKEMVQIPEQKLVRNLKLGWCHMSSLRRCSRGKHFIWWPIGFQIWISSKKWCSQPEISWKTLMNPEQIASHLLTHLKIT